MSETTKRIKILTSGHIPSKGNIYGPVLTPYRETLSSIFGFLAAGVEVVEVLSNGQEVPLTIANYKLNNEPVQKQETEEHTNNGEPEGQKVDETQVVTETPVATEETTETTEEKPDTTTVVDETPVTETTDVVDETSETNGVVDETAEVEDATAETTEARDKHNKKNKKNRH